VAFKSYTSCVQPDQYQDFDLTPQIMLAVFGVLAAIFTYGISLIVSVMAGLSALEVVLNWMLNGKLVCLGGDRCAVGTVASFETVQDKSFPDNVDDDFSINLMLYPFSVETFIGQASFPTITSDAWAKSASCKLVENSEQGVLVTPISTFTDAQKGREAGDISWYAPYDCSLPPMQTYILDNFITQPSGNTSVPVLHCECEGSRIHDLLAFLEGLGSLGSGGGLCSWSFLGIPIGAVICSLVQTVLLPVTLIGLIAAWFGASDGNPDDARTDPNGGELQIADIIAVTGRWSYDAAHTGWNELHPVKTIQKVDPVSAAGGGDLAQLWCGLLSSVPPPDGTTATMTPAQLETQNAQQQPENQWQLHPVVDGCAGSIPPPPSTPPLV
jgi:hypothetical protein